MDKLQIKAVFEGISGGLLLSGIIALLAPFCSGTATGNNWIGISLFLLGIILCKIAFIVEVITHKNPWSSF